MYKRISGTFIVYELGSTRAARCRSINRVPCHAACTILPCVRVVALSTVWLRQYSRFISSAHGAHFRLPFRYLPHSHCYRHRWTKAVSCQDDKVHTLPLRFCANIGLKDLMAITGARILCAFSPVAIKSSSFLYDINKSSSCTESRLFLDDTVDRPDVLMGCFARFSISRHVPQIRFVFLDASSSIPTARGIQNIKSHFYISLRKRHIFPTDTKVIPKASNIGIKIWNDFYSSKW